MEKDKNNLQIEALKEYGKANYQDEINRLAMDNVMNCTRMYAMIRYFEGYFDVYIQNRKEIENLAAKILKESSTNELIHKTANRIQGNKINKLNNLDQRMQNFIKLFNKEFADGFKNPELEEELLDLMDEFWDSVVELKDDKIFIKTK